MARECQVTKKQAGKGFKYTIRGVAKKKKGIGLKVTGKTKRRFQINLFKKRFWFSAENRFVTLRVCAKGMHTIDKLGIDPVIAQLRREGQKV